MSAPAAQQVTPARLAELTGAPEPDAVYNTWYKKWSGVSKRTNQRSPFRCDVAADSGVTSGTVPYICLWFARGMCVHGAACRYLHRVPAAGDRFDAARDCFNRVKHGAYRNDMSGTGALYGSNRTLFVGYFKGVSKLAPRVRAQFEPYGEITGIKAMKTFALVTYARQASAEFAKEAMANQTLTGRETLVVRWARAAERGASQTGADLTDEQKQAVRAIVRRVLGKPECDESGARQADIEDPEEPQEHAESALQGHGPDGSLEQQPPQQALDVLDGAGEDATGDAVEEAAVVETGALTGAPDAVPQNPQSETPKTEFETAPEAVPESSSKRLGSERLSDSKRAKRVA